MAHLYEKKKSSIIYAVLICALLLHIGILLQLGSLQFHGATSFCVDEQPIINPHKKPANMDDTEWAQLCAQKSSFGAPVIFQDIPDDIPEADQEPADTAVASNEQEQQSEHMQTTANQTDEPPAPTAQSNESAQEDIVEPEEPEVTTIAQAPPLPQPTQPKPATAPRKSKPKKIPRPQTTRAPQKPTLAQLAKGFLDHLQDEGTNSINMHGKKGAMPTDEQLKHERFVQRIEWCWQKSMRAHRNRMRDVQPQETAVRLYIALNRNGTIKDLSILEPSALNELNRFALYTFKDASSSFPPVPDYLPDDPYVFSYTLHFVQGSGVNFMRR